MKHIQLEELSRHFTKEMVETLAIMAEEFPPSEEWRMILDHLTDEQRTLINNKLSERQIQKEKARVDAMTPEEQSAELVKRKAWLDQIDPNGFYGNMGQPETIEEYKNRYGVYPPGYQAPDEQK